MNCTIAGPNLKVMGRALQTMSKIGDELYLQASNDGIRMSTVSMSKTCFAVFKFGLPFFSSYSFKPSNAQVEHVECKMPMKGMLAVFRAPQQLDKQVEVCKMELDLNPTKTSFKFRCKFDIIRTQSVWLLDGDTLDLVLSKQTNPSILTAPATFFTDALQNFHVSDEEISIETGVDNKIILRNYVENENSNLAFVRSKLAVNAAEFYTCKINGKTRVTFALKPVRAAVNFAEMFNLDVSFSFEKAGSPTLVLISNVLFEATFILATVRDNEDTEINPGLSTNLPNVTENEFNISQQDREALNSINWDKDFESEQTDKPTEKIRKRNKKDLDRKKFVQEHETENSITPERIPEKLPDENIIPESPESPRTKKMKLVFRRCFEDTYHASNIASDEVILCENSDNEWD